jgi:CMP-N-acetylneuraminic acid synthetase
MKILTIIPAKTDSIRLPKKNLKKIGNKTLIEYSIDYAKKSSFNNTIIVSSESHEVNELVKKNNVLFIKRGLDLIGNAEVTDVYIDVCKSLDEEFDLVVALQPDHPDREHTFDYCVNYLIDNNYDDVITIEPNFKRSGSVRVIKYNHLISGHISKRIGCIKDDATDIHYQKDLERAKNRILNKKKY